MASSGTDSLKTQKQLNVGGKNYTYYSLKEAEKTLGDLSRLPYSLKVLLENLLRMENGRTVKVDDIKAFKSWLEQRTSQREIAFSPTRVLMQDFTGVPAVVDLAAMREAMRHLGGDPRLINPLAPVDLVVDHSVMVDAYASGAAFNTNVEMEYERNNERYAFLRWGQEAFNNFRVVPPGTGICHQVNLEYLAQVVWSKDEDGHTYAYPDSLVGTDSHTTMVNGLGVLGWGVGGIEAEAAMLGQPISMLIPEVIGFKLTGKMREGATATDLVLTVTQMLRAKGVVGKFVEFYGDGLGQLSLADRATIANMAPEYGATCGIFPVDKETINYLTFTNRDTSRIALVEAYAKAQGMWWQEGQADPVFTDTLQLDLGTIEPTMAGPKRPQDKVLLKDAPTSIATSLSADNYDSSKVAHINETATGKTYDVNQGDVVIAAITSCTNTSNPSVMVGAGLIAKKAVEKGLRVKPWVKTSLAPGSQVVTDYLDKAGLQSYLDQLGFNLVGYGCTTCIGNSGPLKMEIEAGINQENLGVCSVLSGNRNFEGRIHPLVKYSYLASPMLVVVYALAGSLKINLMTDPIGCDTNGNPVYMKDLWPTNAEITQAVASCVTPQMFKTRYENVFKGDENWRHLSSAATLTYGWNEESTYVKLPPFFDGLTLQENKGQDSIQNARVLAVFGDSITTDHISPAGSIKETSPAGTYLKKNDVKVTDFNSYGSRRGNHEVMMRGTFANIRLVNEMIPEKPGGYTRYMPEGTEMSIYDAAMAYATQKTPLVIIAGKEYGTGSSRDWAAKGTRLLGVTAVIAEGFERIHRSNLVGMGILPLEFQKGESRKTYGFKGDEVITIEGMEGLTPHKTLQLKVKYNNGKEQNIPVLCRIDTLDELEYFNNGGILQFVLRRLMHEKKAA